MPTEEERPSMFARPNKQSQTSRRERAHESTSSGSRVVKHDRRVVDRPATSRAQLSTSPSPPNASHTTRARRVDGIACSQTPLREVKNRESTASSRQRTGALSGHPNPLGSKPIRTTPHKIPGEFEAPYPLRITRKKTHALPSSAPERQSMTSAPSSVREVPYNFQFAPAIRHTPRQYDTRLSDSGQSYIHRALSHHDESHFQDNEEANVISPLSRPAELFYNNGSTAEPCTIRSDCAMGTLAQVVLGNRDWTPPSSPGSDDNTYDAVASTMGFENAVSSIPDLQPLRLDLGPSFVEQWQAWLHKMAKRYDNADCNDMMPTKTSSTEEDSYEGLG
ncbi:hypothetical protein EK21DRAFT_106391 [Setomelanomma holmii]|uniref:Uncharacterized protein n=1 Tax=Setomelanomma holmii TaxID=210430 RepID=A0A9P4HL68_9PLEO|nr:hypothetical protein EK21DRAFT_106391 [Setomelanomma holmii]